MDPLSLDALAVLALGVALGAVALSALSTPPRPQLPTDTRRILLALVGAALLTSGGVAARSGRFAAALSPTVDLSASANAAVGTAGLVGGLALATTVACWLLGVLAVRRAYSLKRETWWW
jgi:hypothetical protein